jgi:hypothetical protein
MNPPVPDTNLERILQQLAAYSNGTASISPNAINQDPSDDSQWLGVLTQDAPSASAYRAPPQILHEWRHQTDGISHISIESGIKALPRVSESNPTHQSSFLNHLQKLEEITAAAARDSKKRPAEGSTPQPDSEYEPSKLNASPNSILQWAPALRHVSRIGGPGSELEGAVKKVYAKRSWTCHCELI